MPGSNLPRSRRDWRVVVLAGAISLVRPAAVAVSLFHALQWPNARDLDLPRRGCNLGHPFRLRSSFTIPAPAPGTTYPSRCCRCCSPWPLSPSASALRLSSARRPVVAMGGAVVGTGVAAMRYTAVSRSIFRPALCGRP